MSENIPVSSRERNRRELRATPQQRGSLAARRGETDHTFAPAASRLASLRVVRQRPSDGTGYASAVATEDGQQRKTCDSVCCGPPVRRCRQGQARIQSAQDARFYAANGLQ